MTDLTTLTLTQARALRVRGDLSAVDLVDAFSAAIEKQQPELNAFITLTLEQARQQAAAMDAQNKRDGLLPGLPIGVKDLFCTEGVRTTAASNILSNFIPPYESTVTAKLFAEGALMLGKTNLDEFAMGSANITSAFGPVKNPKKATGDTTLCRVPGGSSGGSAAAVAADLCLAATGTDTGGSIRQPAAFCGIVGIKPTYGRCSRYGIVAFASSLDQAGPMTKTVADAALMLQAMAGHDPKDSTSVQRPVPDWLSGLGDSVQGKVIGIPKEYAPPGIHPDILASWERAKTILRDAGCRLVDVSLPHTAYALPCYYIIAPAEASSNLARYDGVRYGYREEAETLEAMYAATRSAGFGAEVKRRILMGTYVLSAGYYDAYYKHAQRVRRLIYNDFMDVFQGVDALLAPTVPSSAFKIGENQSDPVAMYLNDVLTVPASMAGLPALSVPAGLDSQDLPLGWQLIGRPFEEGPLLTLAQRLEEAV
ncbi:MAG: Asp-tRNA(Asn)/Glu-tRNA(Gln) amidotransferase subunit GatA [Alphaproteobacteria bacterium]